MADEVATILGMASGPAFLRRRAVLEADHGFPLPGAQSLRPMVWRREQVEYWAAAQSAPKGEDASPVPAVRDALMRRAMTA